MEKQEFECLTLCPLDGRYSGVKDALGEYFSEYALVKYRVFVEIQWLRFLIENVENDILAKFNHDDMDKLMAITNEFNLSVELPSNYTTYEFSQSDLKVSNIDYSDCLDGSKQTIITDTCSCPIQIYQSGVDRTHPKDI